jgi:hypothetical protein
MSDWYKTSYRAEKVERINVTKFSDKSVWVDNVRAARHSEYYDYFPSWKEAREHMIDRAHTRLEIAKRRVDTCRSVLEIVKATKQP